MLLPILRPKAGMWSSAPLIEISLKLWLRESD